MSQFVMNKTLGRSIILGVVAILLGVLISKQLSKTDAKEGPKISFRSKIVEVEPVTLSSVPLNIVVSGRLKASDRMEIYSEVTGILSNQNFKEGNRFSAGQLLMNVNSSEFESQLKAQKSTFMGLLSQSLADMSIDYSSEYPAWSNFLQAIDQNKPLPPMPTISNQQLKQFVSSRNILSSYYTIQSQEERLRKHSITAPYSGILSEALIDPGTLVRSGQKLGTFVRNGAFELEAAVSKQDLDHLKLGSSVILHSTESNKNYKGTISRINSVIDANTQMVSVFLKVEGSDLREGLYLSATISGGVADKAQKIKRNLIVDHSFVYIVKPDSTLSLAPIEVLNYTENFAVVRGTQIGDLLPTRMISGAFEGMKVIPTVTKKLE